MKLIFIRHGDPDYENDSLTEKGFREAEILSERVAKLMIKDIYVSPLGRAWKTAEPSLKKLGREAVTCDWLREFNAPVDDERTGTRRIPWDMLPEEWTTVPDYYDKDKWHSTPRMKTGAVKEEAERVAAGIDEILASHGYVREGNLYRAVKPNRDTLVFFCHFGVQCVILGHLLGLSAANLWHSFCAAPTSVTTLITEERREGKAYFRVNAFGDISHLYAAGEEPAFAARFCETFDDENERHD